MGGGGGSGAAVTSTVTKTAKKGPQAGSMEGKEKHNSGKDVDGSGLNVCDDATAGAAVELDTHTPKSQVATPRHAAASVQSQHVLNEPVEYLYQYEQKKQQKGKSKGYLGVPRRARIRQGSLVSTYLCNSRRV